MIIYGDTERELTISDYKPLPPSLSRESVENLKSLRDNLTEAADNAFIYGSDMLALALDMDIRKVDIYLRFAMRKAEKQAAKKEESEA